MRKRIIIIGLKRVSGCGQGAIILKGCDMQVWVKRRVLNEN